jgi:hypothetical protein
MAFESSSIGESFRMLLPGGIVRQCSVWFRALGMAMFAIAVLGACGGSHDTASSLLPALWTNAKFGHGKALAAVGTAGSDIVAINAGGSAAGSFAADTDYAATSTWTYATTSTITTSAISNAAPQAVYQTEREGSSIGYTIPGLTPGATYTVRLSFAELWWTAAGQRVFNVSINGAKVLSNFDIFATAGGRNKAVLETFSATAGATGTIAITFGAVTNYAAISAVEIATAPAATPTPTPTPAPTSAPAATLSINAGGAAIGAFIADRDYAATGTWTYATTNTIGTASVTNPAPQAVYANEREGSSITYTIPGLTAGAAYAVKLDFAELWFTAAGQRVFNVRINGQSVLTNFDIFATTGSRYKATAQTFNTTATSAGAIVIALTAVANYAAIDGIEITAASTPAPSATFNDYVTFGYDNRRDVYNPNSTAITPTSLTNLHLAWQAALGGGDYNTQTQPVLATEIAGHAGVLFVGGGSGNVYAYDALSGSLMWTRNTGQEQYTCENGYTVYFGVGGTVAYDPSSRSLYAIGNANASPNAIAANTLYHLDGASGSILGQVNVAPAVAGWPSLDFSHTSVTLGANGLAYVGTGATCDISSWRGRVAAVNVSSMTLANTFYPDWNGTAQPWGGGGVWGWGGVSLDANGNVYTGVGNTDDGSTTHGSIVAPFAAAPKEYSGLGDAVIELSGDLSRLEDSQHPIPPANYSGDSADLDLNGTPALFTPAGAGCPQMAAIQGKSGALYLYDAPGLSQGPVAQYQLAPSTYADGFLGDPAYSPATGLLYVAVPSSNGSLFAPGMIAINPGCGSPSVAWHAAFGPDSYSAGSDLSPGQPRTAPAVSAGGVVFVGTICTPTGDGCSATAASAVLRRGAATVRKPFICCAPAGTGGGALWALDASSGAVLNGGEPLIITSGPLRMPPTIDGNWVFVLDNNGDMYGLTIDPNYPAVAEKARAINARMLTHWARPSGTI